MAAGSMLLFTATASERGHNYPRKWWDLVDRSSPNMEALGLVQVPGRCLVRRACPECISSKDTLICQPTRKGVGHYERKYMTIQSYERLVCKPFISKFPLLELIHRGVRMSHIELPTLHGKQLPLKNQHISIM